MRRVRNLMTLHCAAIPTIISWNSMCCVRMCCWRGMRRAKVAQVLRVAAHVVSAPCVVLLVLMRLLMLVN